MDEIEIVRAEETDLDAILQIQYAAFREEAEARRDVVTMVYSARIDEI